MNRKNCYFTFILLFTLTFPFSYGVTAKSKLTVHTGFLGPYSMKFVEKAKPRMIKLLGAFDKAAEIKRISPQTVIIGRIFLPHQPMDGDPVKRAQEWWIAYSTEIKKYPDVDFWEGYNEPGNLDVTQMKWYAEFEKERIRLLDTIGEKACIGNFATGNIATPQENPDVWAAFAPAFDAAKSKGSILGLHEYGCPMNCAFDEKTQEGVLCGRYRKLYRGYLIPQKKIIPLAITECGVDSVASVSGCCGTWGWRNGYLWDEYRDQLTWYDNILKQDEYVIGATIYCLEIHNWKTFDIADVDLMGWLTNYVADSPNEDTVAPSIPNLLIPGDNAVLETLPLQFDWTDVTEPKNQSLPVRYELQIDEDINFTSPIIAYMHNVSTSSYNLSGLPVGTYYYRVRAKDTAPYPNVSKWTSVRKITVKVTGATVLPLENNGFESGFEFWTQHPDPAAVFSMDTKNVYKGKNSVRVVSTATADTHLWQASAINSVGSGKSYKFTVWVKTGNVVKSNPESHGVALRLLWMSNDAYHGYGEKWVDGPTGTTGWTKIEVTLPSPLPPAEPERVQVALFFHQATGTVWFDEVNSEQE